MDNNDKNVYAPRQSRAADPEPLVFSQRPRQVTTAVWCLASSRSHIHVYQARQ